VRAARGLALTAVDADLSAVDRLPAAGRREAPTVCAHFARGRNLRRADQTDQRTVR